MVGVSGLRGIVGRSLTSEVAVRYAQTVGAWLAEQSPAPAVVVARDGRAGGDAIYADAIEGLLDAGVDVFEADVCMTPTVGVIVDELNLAGGVMVTASHNPQQWNGLKVIRGSEDGACAPDAEAAAAIVDRFNSGLSASGSKGKPKRLDFDPSARHTERVVGHLGRLGRSFRVVVDSVNASGRIASPMLMSALGCELVRHLGSDDSGIFPHTPEPTRDNLSGKGGLCDVVAEIGADVGFAQDPDADRLAIVDENGAYIGEELTLALCAVSVLEAVKPEAGTPMLCTNLSTSRMIDDVAARYGAKVVRSAVGEANVVEAMKRLKREGKTVVLGGEGNGGVIWPEVTYVRDSLSAMALVLSLMARTGKRLSDLVADVPAYAIVKRKQPLARKEDAVPALERVASAYADQRVDRQDGVRVDFDADRSWVHVRASNTEPILRLIAEAPTAERAESLLDEVHRLVDAG